MEPSVIISLLSLAGMIVFGVLTAAHNNSGDVRQQIEEAKKEAAANAKIELSLDSIKADTGEIRSEQRTMRMDINDYGKRLVIVEQSAKSAHHRIDRLDNQLEIAHQASDSDTYGAKEEEKKNEN